MRRVVQPQFEAGRCIRCNLGRRARVDRTQDRLPQRVGNPGGRSCDVVEARGLAIATGAPVTDVGRDELCDGQFSFPRALWVDAAGNLYVADRNNHRMQKFMTDGTFLVRWGGLIVFQRPEC